MTTRPTGLGPLNEAIRMALTLLKESGLQGAFGGGLAVVVWGRPRTTQDLDLLLDISPGQADQLLQAAAVSGYRYDPEGDATPDELLGGGFIRLLPTVEARSSFPLDILVADTPLHEAALARAMSFSLFDQHVPVLTAEDLILLRLVAFRPKDTFDLETVIDAVGDDLDRGYLRSWADRLALRERLETFLTPPPLDD